METDTDLILKSRELSAALQVKLGWPWLRLSRIRLITYAGTEDASRQIVA